ncbi:MAG: hypothetical protein P1U74_06945 [Legionellaceae bacterium]|nr:hypothetical protein [Legionellaceae bacterium]
MKSLFSRNTGAISRLSGSNLQKSAFQAQSVRDITNTAKKVQTQIVREEFNRAKSSFSRGATEDFKMAQRHLRGMMPLARSQDDMIASAYYLKKTAAILTAMRPAQGVSTELITQLKTIYTHLIKNTSDDFVRLLLASNDLSESRYPNLMGSPAVLRAWLENCEQFESQPFLLGGVLESLLSGIGKSMYQLGLVIKDKNGEDIILCQFTKEGKRNEAGPLDEYIAKFATTELQQRYERGPGGVFEDINKSVITGLILDPNLERDIVYSDGFCLVGEDGREIHHLSGSRFDMTKSELLKSWGEHGLHLQYGPSGTTRACMGVISLNMAATGRGDDFLQDIEGTMKLVTHGVMIPYLKGGYHTPEEVLIATHCYIDTALGQDFKLKPPLEILEELRGVMIRSTAEGAPQEVVQAVWDVQMKFAIACRDAHKYEDKKQTNPTRELKEGLKATKESDEDENTPSNRLS